jgi:hypothetical protein
LSDSNLTFRWGLVWHSPGFFSLMIIFDVILIFVKTFYYPEEKSASIDVLTFLVDAFE